MTACHRLSLPLAGFVSDGDARLRKTDYRVNFKSNHDNDPIKWVSSTYREFVTLQVYLALSSSTRSLITRDLLLRSSNLLFS